MNLLRYRVELVLAAACWGSGTVAVKYALGGIAPMTVLMVELLSATAIVWLVVLARGITRPPRPGRLFLLGVFEPGLTYAAVDLGLMHTNASDASLLGGTESLFVVLLAAMFLRQRLNRMSLLAVCLAVAGVAALSGSAPSLATGWGNLLVVVGSLCAAIYVTLASRLAPETATLPMTAYQFLAGTVISLPFAIVQWSVDGSVLPSHSTPSQWAVAVLAGVVGLAASFLLYNHAIAAVPVTTAGMILNLIPLFGVVGAAAFLGERLNGWQAVGAVGILAGLVLFALAEDEPATEAGRPEPPLSGALIPPAGTTGGPIRTGDPQTPT